MMKLYLKLKYIFIWMKSFLNYFALKTILLNILQNFAMFLFRNYDNFSKSHISILQGKLKFLVLHNFTKYFLKIMFTKLLLDSRSSQSYVLTKIVKIRAPSPLVRNRTHLAWPLFICTYFLYIHPPPLLINFYSDSSFRHSQFLAIFIFTCLRLNFVKPISKRFLWFLFIA